MKVDIEFKAKIFWNIEISDEHFIEVKNAFVKHFKEEVEKMLSEEFFDSRCSGRVEIEVQKMELTEA